MKTERLLSEIQGRKDRFLLRTVPFSLCPQNTSPSSSPSALKKALDVALEKPMTDPPSSPQLITFLCCHQRCLGSVKRAIASCLEKHEEFRNRRSGEHETVSIRPIKREKLAGTRICFSSSSELAQQ